MRLPVPSDEAHAEWLVKVGLRFSLSDCEFFITVAMSAVDFKRELRASLNRQFKFDFPCKDIYKKM